MYTVLRTKDLKEKVGVGGFLEVFTMSGMHPVIEGGQILIDFRKTRLVNKYADNNMVVDDGRRTINEFLAGHLTSLTPITYFCTGTGGYIGEQDANVDPATPLSTDHALYTPLYQKSITSIDLGNPNPLASVYITTIDETESNGSLTEFGMRTKESTEFPTGRLFCRRTTRPMWKDTNVFFVCKWTIQI